jgi:hypothetical protein
VVVGILQTMIRIGMLAVAILLLSAGCVADPGVEVAGEADPIRSPNVEPIDLAPDGDDDDDGSGPRRVSSLPENPWGAERVTVGIEAAEPGANKSDYRTAVEETVDYWNANADRYGAYDATFELDGETETPDVVVRFTSTVRCRGEPGWIGCAPLLDATSVADPPTTVLINSEYDQATIQRTVKHEFGHLLGIRHGEAPMPLMETDASAGVSVESSAIARSNPWREDVIDVYVSTDGLGERRAAAVERQVDTAVAYYDEGAEGTVPENVTFRRTGSQSDAEVVVLFRDDPWCREGSGSCARVSGVDTDRDGTVEYYSGSTIVLSNVGTEAVGWHVGYWLGEAMGASSRDELSPAFQSGTKRTGDWWNTSS